MRLQTFGLISLTLMSALDVACENSTCEDDKTCPWDVPPEAGEDGGGGDAAVGTDAQGGGDATIGEDGGGGTDATGGGTDAEDAAGDAGVDTGPTCDPTKTPAESACVISDGLATFVAPTGSDTAAGTMAAPVATLAKAVTLAKALSAPRVIACSSAGSFTTALSLSGAANDVGVQIYGGVSCTGASWTYSGQKTVVAPTPTGPAFSLSGLSKKVSIADFEFDAQPGNAATPGDSSVGALFANATVSLTRVKVVAQDGVAGSGGDDVREHGTGDRKPQRECGGTDSAGSGERLRVRGRDVVDRR